MHGSPSLPFSQLFADTLCTHGAVFAQRYYTKRGMPAWEFSFWLSTVPVIK